jgi:hypothetical protein
LLVGIGLSRLAEIPLSFVFLERHKRVISSYSCFRSCRTKYKGRDGLCAVPFFSLFWGQK